MTRRALATLLALQLVPLSAVASDEEEPRQRCAAHARAQVEALEGERALASSEREVALKSAFETCMTLVEEARAAEAAKAAAASGDEGEETEEKKGFDWKEFFMRGANKPRVRSPSGKKVYRE